MHVGRLKLESHLALIPQRAVASTPLTVHGDNASTPVGMEFRIFYALEIECDFLDVFIRLEADDVISAEPGCFGVGNPVRVLPAVHGIDRA